METLVTGGVLSEEVERLVMVEAVCAGGWEGGGVFDVAFDISPGLKAIENASIGH